MAKLPKTLKLFNDKSASIQQELSNGGDVGGFVEEEPGKKPGAPKYKSKGVSYTNASQAENQ